MSHTESSLSNSHSSTKPITGKEHWITSKGIKIFIWEKYLDNPDGKPVVVLAHGSATAGRESFDLKITGKPSYSVMAQLADLGFDVFAPDIRGFGRSTKPEEHITTQQACEDLNAAVEYILHLRQTDKVHLLAWSWGTQYGGLFVMAHSERVARYVSYAQMHSHSPDIVLRRAKVDLFRKNAYVSIPQQGWKPRFYSMTPDSANDPEVVDTFAETAARIETKTPTGPQLDMVSHLPMVHARLIPVPTMIIHGEYDDVADTGGLLSFFDQLPNSDKRYVVIPGAGHMMHLQKGHKRFQDEVAHFLKADDP